jgi:hypothetical protein
MTKVAEKTYRILIVDGQGDEYMLLENRGGNGKFERYIASSISEMRMMLIDQRFDALIADYTFPDGTVFDILEEVKDIPVIVVTDSGNEEIAVKAMKAGACDYIVKDREGNYLRVLPLTIESAIQKKKTEKKLQLLESAVANANDAIIILEAEPGEMKGRRIMYVNDAFTRMTGYTYEEAVGNTLRILRGPKTSLSALNKIRMAFEQRKPVRVELINYRKDGSEFWAECNIVPFADDKGSFLHWVSVQRDITERKKAEEERERLLKKIEEINTDLTQLNRELETIGTERTMSLMALTVADRIRNPASMIGGMCKRLLAKSNVPEEIKGDLQCILEGAQKLEKIVKDFETLLKEKQYKFKLENLNTVVEKVVSALEKEARSKNIEIKLDLSGECPFINMQRDMMRIAVYHVLKNAIEATPDGGLIYINTSRDGNHIVLSVKDTGYGIPEEDLKNIFKPFFSTKEKGFGMGLPLVKQIVSEHLGELIIDSKPGYGTTVKMRFPMRWIEKDLCRI